MHTITQEYLATINGLEQLILVYCIFDKKNIITEIKALTGPKLSSWAVVYIDMHFIMSNNFTI